ncbi:homeobox expressed in ES cells 1 [Nematostella vectensis]|uniref:homeobox expressed in ES cells 1 n=1 Tax=Nematostella vectensis TaxID=45351 RepID=UPI0020770D04|nr:homeobox expressed in ES cells 1 [Nematostella vectensis]
MAANHSEVDQTESDAAETLLQLRRESEKRIRWQCRLDQHQPCLTNHSPYHPPWPSIYPPSPMAFDMRSYAWYFPFAIPGGQPRPWFAPSQFYVRPPQREAPPGSEMGLGFVAPQSRTDGSRGQEVASENIQVKNDEATQQSTSDRADIKRKRRNLTKRQQKILETAYRTIKYPTIEDRHRLETSTQLSEDRIQVWFQNRRAKDRRLQDGAAIPHGAKATQLEKGSATDESETLNEEADSEENLSDEPADNVQQEAVALRHMECLWKDSFLGTD